MSNIDDLLNSVIGGSSTPETDVDDTDVVRSSLAWALDCDWAWSNQGEHMTLVKAGSRGRYEAWKLCKSDPADFCTKIMTRVSPILQKHESTNKGEEVIRIEGKKDVAELQRFLRETVRASRG